MAMNFPCLKCILLALTVLAMNLSAEESKHSTFEARKIEGWNVRVDTKLIKGDKELTHRLLRSLAERLSHIKTVIGEPHLSGLQAVTIVLEKKHSELVPMQYHPSADWLKSKGYDVSLAKCVHLPVAEAILKKRVVSDMPWVILHELAHAYHHQVIGFENEEIIKAYEKFKASGNGDNCLHYSGKKVRHYGLTDHKEFFAEMTEAYFGTNDFYPFNHGELKVAEPEIYKLIEEVWKPSKS